MCTARLITHVSILSIIIDISIVERWLNKCGNDVQYEIEGMNIFRRLQRNGLDVPVRLHSVPASEMVAYKSNKNLHTHDDNVKAYYLHDIDMCVRVLRLLVDFQEIRVHVHVAFAIQ